MIDNTELEAVRMNGGESPPSPLRLRAGRLKAEFAGGVLRNIRVDDGVILQQVYAAVRDHNWGTIAGDIQNIETSVGDNGFRIRFDVAHHAGPIHFTWVGTITGAPDSTIRFEMNGEAGSDFERNRIGFCCLHPLELAGTECELTHSDGSCEQSHFPRLVAPHQPFLDLAAICHRISGGEAAIHFAGDVFETEDQRNWIDASFKTYCTPLGLPFPAAVKAGDLFRQAVTVAFAADDAVETSSPRPAPSAVAAGVVPKIGLGLGTDDPDDEATAIFAALHAGFAHSEVDCSDSDVTWTAAALVGKAAAMGAPLHLSIRTPDRDVFGTLEKLAVAIAQEANTIRRVTLIPGLPLIRDAAWLVRARALFPATLDVGAGCDTNFAELNRNRPNPALIDHIAFAANPQVHIFDNRSIAENIPSIADACESALALAGGKALFFGPATLRQVRNPVATREEAVIPGQPPKDVDVRQMSLFAAAWLAGAVVAAAKGGAGAISFFTRATGWRGVCERGVGTELPDFFPSAPGQLFPVFHALKFFAARVGREIVPLPKGEDGLAGGCLMRGDSGDAVVLYSPGAEETTIETGDVVPRGEYSRLRLDLGTYEEAARDVDWLERRGARIRFDGAARLPACSVVFMTTFEA